MQHVKWRREGAQLVVPTGHCHRVYVVTSEGSDAWRDIISARDRLSSALLPSPSNDSWELVPCSLYSVASIASALQTRRNRVLHTYLVLAARGGGQWLDHCEDEHVVDALVQLAELCPTYTAIGHAKDSLMLDGIVHDMFETPSSAIYRLDQILRDARCASHSTSVPMHEHAGQAGEPDLTAGGRPQESEPSLQAPAPQAPQLGRADARLAIGALAIIAILGLLVPLIYPARRPAAPVPSAPSATAAREEQERRRAQTDRSAAQKPPSRSRAAATAVTRERDMSSDHDAARAHPTTLAALQRPATEPAAPGKAQPTVPLPAGASENPKQPLRIERRCGSSHRPSHPLRLVVTWTLRGRHARRNMACGGRRAAACPEGARSHSACAADSSR